MLVHQDIKSQWWFATWGDGIYRYDGKNIVHFTTKHGLSHNRTDQIAEDSAGNLYFNTREGVCRYDASSFDWLTSDDVNELHDGRPAQVFRFSCLVDDLSSATATRKTNSTY
jgi:ligand-binding sensor domain-containing protein